MTREIRYAQMPILLYGTKTRLHCALLDSRQRTAKRTAVSKCKWDLGEREIFLKVSFEEGQTEARQRLGTRKITAGAVRKGS